MDAVTGEWRSLNCLLLTSYAHVGSENKAHVVFADSDETATKIKNLYMLQWM